MNPLLARLQAEGQLINASRVNLGSDDAFGGQYDAMVIDYRIAPGSDPRQIVAAEGRWNDVFEKSEQQRISSWLGRNAASMMARIWLYHARGRTAWIWSLATALLFVAALYTIRGHISWLPGALERGEGRWLSPALGAAAFAAAAIGIVPDALKLSRAAGKPSPARDWLAGALSSAAGISTLLIYQLQRGFTLMVVGAGIVVLPVAVVFVRLLSTIPFLGSVSKNLIVNFETALLGGGIADMEAVANNQVNAAAIRTRLRGALIAIEEQVKPGGTITIVAHSGGAPPAWRLLSEPEIAQRQAKRGHRFRYRLITVAAALTWAKHGFGDMATPLDAALVNADLAEPGGRTHWANVYAAWDSVPHGPVNAGEFAGWTPWADGDGAPNYVVRNVGAPVPLEHGEYWRNQQEFVPLVVRAIDPDVAWATQAAGNDHVLWSNARLALVSALVRARLALVALPAAAVFAAVRGERFVHCKSEDYQYRSTVIDGVARGTDWLLGKIPGDLAVGERVCDAPVLSSFIVAAGLALAAYALLDVYTNYLWQSLGRRVRPLTVEGAPPGHHGSPIWSWAWRWFYAWRGAFQRTCITPVWPVLLVWLPTIVILPALLQPFHIGQYLFWIATINAALALLEVVWLNSCLHALRATGPERLRAVCTTGIGRQRGHAGGAAGGPAAAQAAAGAIATPGATS